MDQEKGLLRNMEKRLHAPRSAVMFQKSYGKFHLYFSFSKFQELLKL